jgi:putative transposase
VTQSQWLTAQEIAEAKLAGLPATRRGVQMLAEREGWAARRDRNGKPLWRERTGRGGGKEWHVSVLPVLAQGGLASKEVPPSAFAEATARQAPATISTLQDDVIAERIAAFERLPAAQRRVAEERLAIIDRAESLIASRGKSLAVAFAARESGVAKSTIWNWLAELHGQPRQARLALLAPKPKGKPPRCEIAEDIWHCFLDDWLRPAQPTFESCYRRVQKLALKQGKNTKLADLKTFIRRVRESVSISRQVLMREGIDALYRMFPSQERDRSHFGALECVCADGHKWDVFVEYPDGKIDRPVSVAFQDLATNKIVSARHGRSETAQLVALAIHDMARDYGVPDQCWLDNGRAFASKWITGQMANRYRFKVKDSDPEGLLTQLGVRVHWVKPYSGQSKPIERAWRDFCDNISKHPAFAGAYTGNAPHAKPSDYATKAVPLAVFEKIVAEGIAEHNARIGRRTRTCGGVLSFDQAFAKSYATRLIAKPAPAQLRMFLLESQQVSVRAPDACVFIAGNRFWHEALHGHMGRKVVARFDPDNLKAPLALYQLSGEIICVADCLEAVGFDSSADAKEHEKGRKAWLRSVKELAALEQRFKPEDICSLIADVSDEDEVAPAPIRPAATRIMGNLARALEPVAAEAFDPILDFYARQTEGRASHLRLVEADDAE